MLLKKSGEIAPETRKTLSQSGNSTQLWICLVVKVKSCAIKKNIAWEPGMLGKGSNQRSKCHHLLDQEKAREFQRSIYFCFID